MNKSTCDEKRSISGLVTNGGNELRKTNTKIGKRQTFLWQFEAEPVDKLSKQRKRKINCLLLNFLVYPCRVIFFSVCEFLISLLFYSTVAYYSLRSKCYDSFVISLCPNFVRTALLDSLFGLGYSSYLKISTIYGR